MTKPYRKPYQFGCVICGETKRFDHYEHGEAWLVKHARDKHNRKVATRACLNTGETDLVPRDDPIQD